MGLKCFVFQLKNKTKNKPTLHVFLAGLMTTSDIKKKKRHPIEVLSFLSMKVAC